MLGQLGKTEMTGLVDDGRTLDIVYMDCSKAFDTPINHFLVNNLLTYEPDEQTIQGLVISGTV